MQSLVQIVKGRVLLNRVVVSLEEGIHGARLRASLRRSHHPAHARSFLGTWQCDKTGSANVGETKQKLALSASTGMLSCCSKVWLEGHW